MFAALAAKLVPIRDYLYIAAFAAIVGYGVYLRQHLINEGEAKESAAIVKTSIALQAKAVQQVAALTAEHTAIIKGLQEKHDAQIAALSAQHDSDAQRLRDYDTYRREHPAVQSTTSGSGAAPAGAGGTDDVDKRLSSLEVVALQLTQAGGQLNVELQRCQKERDDLVGK